MFPTRKPFIRVVKKAIWITDNYAVECVLSQSRKAAFMRVCQPLPAKAKGTKGVRDISNFRFAAFFIPVLLKIQNLSGPASVAANSLLL